VITTLPRPAMWLIALIAGAALVVAAACADDGDTDDGLLPGLDGTPTATEPGAPAATPTDAPGGGAQPGATIDLALQDIAYSETEIEATAGQAITIRMTNEGVLPHDFVIDEIDVADLELSGDATEQGVEADNPDIGVHLQSGQSGDVTFTPQQAGEYTFYCSVPGHREAGMEGTLIVR
jgi:uncharacterized cupredoxin-like copper-binding protein